MTSSTSADSRRKGGERRADSEARSDVGSEITFYWNAAAELDSCSGKKEQAGKTLIPNLKIEEAFDKWQSLGCAQVGLPEACFMVVRIYSRCE
ncbi:hypothetical protein E5288_WYG015560 [Bos mutus]|uniref:Uncharacterized protein n=1 Tax=Bos mutus TaxID=72004 RepID=A0A6B0RMN9_9CETA|nr:hypothetical protein [Bos mutus]